MCCSAVQLLQLLDRGSNIPLTESNWDAAAIALSTRALLSLSLMLNLPNTLLCSNFFFRVWRYSSSLVQICSTPLCFVQLCSVDFKNALPLAPVLIQTILFFSVNKIREGDKMKKNVFKRALPI